MDWWEGDKSSILGKTWYGLFYKIMGRKYIGKTKVYVFLTTDGSPYAVLLSASKVTKYSKLPEEWRQYDSQAQPVICSLLL